MVELYRTSFDVYELYSIKFAKIILLKVAWNDSLSLSLNQGHLSAS